MSRITPKNLQYDGTLPPFLAKLQANNNSRDDRHEFHVARPKKQRTAEDEAEDEPVYFDEGTGETLTKTEWEEKDKAEEDEAKEVGKDALGVEGKDEVKSKESKEKVAAIGASKKRKVGKVIGVEEGGDLKEESKTEMLDSGSKAESKSKPLKKSKKKIKLSFGDDE
jgi:hypothetical protein